jgi:hypothetical protein
MNKPKKAVNKSLSDSELAAKYDNGVNAKIDFDRTLKNLTKTRTASSIAKKKIKFSLLIPIAYNLACTLKYVIA